MNYRLIFIISTICLLTGALYLAVYNEWLIVRLPSYQNGKATDLHYETAVRKKVILYFWHHNAWHTEQTEILVSDRTTETISHLITSWLTVLYEEQISKKTVGLQAVLLAASGNEIYVSFDRNPLNKEQSAKQKWLWVEGLLKTLRENDIKLQGVYFLVHHHPMTDYHLDFSRAWPLTGFFTK